METTDKTSDGDANNQFSRRSTDKVPDGNNPTSQPNENVDSPRQVDTRELIEVERPPQNREELEIVQQDAPTYDYRGSTFYNGAVADYDPDNPDPQLAEHWRFTSKDYSEGGFI